MALHINLYHEIYKEEQARRRDPAKLATYAGIALVVLLIGIYGYEWISIEAVRSQAQEQERQWKKLEPQATAAKAKEADLLAQQKVNAALVDRLQSRFYWAEFLTHFQEVVPANVQITQFNGDVDAQKSKQANITLNGVAAGEQARTAAEDFRVGLQQKLAPYYSDVSAIFDGNSLEDSQEVVQLNGKSLNTVTFRIRLQFKITPPAPVAPTAASPTPRQKKAHE